MINPDINLKTTWYQVKSSTEIILKGIDIVCIKINDHNIIIWFWEQKFIQFLCQVYPTEPWFIFSRATSVTFQTENFQSLTLRRHWNISPNLNLGSKHETSIKHDRRINYRRKKYQNSSQNLVSEKAVIRVANKHLAHLLRSLQELI